MYYEGKGVLEDNVKAHMWINLGATNGSELGREARDLLPDGIITYEKVYYRYIV